MRTLAHCAVATLCLLLLGFASASPLSSQGIQPVAAESRVDEPTPYRVRDPSVLVLDEQRALVVWSNDRLGLLANFVDQDPGSDLVLVANSTFPSNPGEGEVVTRHHPSAASLPGGDFLLVWTEESALLRAAVFFYDFDVHDRNIFAQHFDANAAPIGEAFQVNEASDALESHPEAISLGDGRIAVTWETRNAVFVRLVSADGVIGPEIRVNQTRASETSRPTLARDPSGVVMLAWTGRDGSGTGVFARLFDRDLRPLTDELVVNGDRHSHQRRPSVAPSRTDGFLVAWMGRTGKPGEWRIFTQAVSADGQLIGVERLVSGDSADADNSATVVTSLDGRYLVLWLTWARPFPIFVGGVELDASGQAMSEIFQVNSEQPLQQDRMDAVVAPDGSILVTWEGYADRSTLGISTRRLEGPTALRAQRALD